jgi:hypothetical protein
MLEYMDTIRLPRITDIIIALRMAHHYLCSRRLGHGFAA